MANPEHVAKLKDGVEAWNAWMVVETSILTLGSYDLGVAVAEQPELAHATFTDTRRVDLSGAVLDDAKLPGRNLSGANLRGARLTRADLAGVDLSGADLREADLRHAWITGATLKGANLRGANLGGALLNASNLQKVDLAGATITEANLNVADLTGADLTGVDLSGAGLNRTTLRGATLRGADLSWAHLSETLFENTDLREVKGLETCDHSGASTLDHRTLAQSGALPLVFLRGCGLPEAMIESLPAVFGYGREFASCFISYSTKDQEFADRLYEDLHAKGVKCWFAPHDIQGGKKIHEQIDEAIRVYDRLLLILSTDSMGSEWVKTEIAKARRREVTERRRMLFPVPLVGFEALREWELFDGDTGKDSAREIREYFVPDFSGWRDENDYRRELERLVKDLGAG